MTNSIAIIGGGFAGITTAIQLIKKAISPIRLHIVGEKEHFARGIAYQPYSKRHILNVIAGKMSAFPDQPEHFLNWLMEKEDYGKLDKAIIASSFISRKVYGDYLSELWQNALIEAHTKGIQVVEIRDSVIGLEVDKDGYRLRCKNSLEIIVNQCVIATGNQIPKNPTIPNANFFKSPNYFQNPWSIQSVMNVQDTLPLLIVGNGLTMVDTLIGLEEQGYHGEIYSISPNGFNILPHRHSGMSYKAHLEEIKDGMNLRDLAKVIHRHVKIVRQFGISAEPIIDALRPMTQKLWRSLSSQDKKLFMARFRHLFGVARHRIPLHIYDKIQKLRIDGKLHIQSGKILDILETHEGVQVSYWNRKTRAVDKIMVSRVINCTGPETDFSRLENSFLSQCIQDELICQDELKLGLNTNIENFKVLYKDGREHANLYTLGSNLKGELWESTAVNELRQQAEALSIILLANEDSENMQEDVSIGSNL